MNDNIAYTGDILQNQFTAYVELALRNNRISYYRHFIVIQKHEISIGSEEDLNLHIDLLNISRIDTEDFGDIDPDNLSPFLSNVIRNISPKDRIILRLRILNGYPYQKIAVIMQMSSDAVRSRYSRAIRKIRRRLEESTK